MKRIGHFLSQPDNWYPLMLSFWGAWLAVDLTAEPMRVESAVADACLMMALLVLWIRDRKWEKR